MSHDPNFFAAFDGKIIYQIDQKSSSSFHCAGRLDIIKEEEF